MSEEVSDKNDDMLNLAASIVVAYISHNPIPAGELPNLIDAVRNALAGLNSFAPEPMETLVPAIPIKKSITPDYIISLEDGKPYRTMKRHLAIHGLTPETYREKWGLRSDYPMVAPNYSAIRSRLAKSLGLGNNNAASRAVAEPKRTRGRPKKSVNQ